MFTEISRIKLDYFFPVSTALPGTCSLPLPLGSIICVSRAKRAGTAGFKALGRRNPKLRTVGKALNRGPLVQLGLNPVICGRVRVRGLNPRLPRGEGTAAAAPAVAAENGMLVPAQSTPPIPKGQTQYASEGPRCTQRPCPQF